MPKAHHNERRAAAGDLLDIHRRIKPDLDRVEDLKTTLKGLADGENFQEKFEGEGVVKVSSPKDGKLQGIIPELDATAFLALPKARREKLIEQGLVIMTEKRSKKFYGSVTVEAF